MSQNKLQKIHELDGDELLDVFDLAFHVTHLFMKEPFFARISRYLRKRPTRAIPTAGVRFNKQRAEYELLYNPDFFLGLKNDFRKFVLMHEFYHIALGHCFERKLETTAHQKQNIAGDLAIHGLPNMREMARAFKWTDENGKEQTPCVPGIGPYENLQDGMSMEWYLARLPDQPEGGGNGQGDGQFDDHSGWDDPGDSDSQPGDGNDISTAAAKAIAERKLQDVIKKAIRETQEEAVRNGSSEWGTVSAETQKRIRAAMEHKLDPKKVLESFIKRSRQASKRKSITKVNRRFPYIHPGKKVSYQAHVAISIDQSGSVSDAMLEKFFGWLNDLAKIATFTIVPFDHEVFEEKIYVWEKGMKRRTERVLCGGTCFDAPTRWVNGKDFDGHIILTDMCAPKPIRSNCQRMWITDQANARHQYFQTTERVLTID